MQEQAEETEGEGLLTANGRESGRGKFNRKDRKDHTIQALKGRRSLDGGENLLAEGKVGALPLTDQAKKVGILAAGHRLSEGLGRLLLIPLDMPHSFC